MWSCLWLRSRIRRFCTIGLRRCDQKKLLPWAGSADHDRLAITEAVKIRLLGEIVKGLTRQGNYGQLVATELAGILSKLLKQPADDIQEILGELWIGHVPMLSPLGWPAAPGWPRSRQSSAKQLQTVAMDLSIVLRTVSRADALLKPRPQGADLMLDCS